MVAWTGQVTRGTHWLLSLTGGALAILKPGTRAGASGLFNRAPLVYRLRAAKRGRDETGEFAPLHCTAHGKVLLADYNLKALKALFGPAPLHAYTRNTITSLTKLARACGRVRADGFAMDDGEYIDEVMCVAAPIRDPEGEIVASVGISSPLTRLRRERINRTAAEVVAAARAISASLVS